MSGKDNQLFWLEKAQLFCEKYGVSKQIIQRFIRLIEKKEATEDE
ncbi:hypothetical protein [Brevibacillus thermoruber]|nr:hypothetical protein [Brevibacillus thermoruber]